MTKALLVIDYTNDFVADNGSLTCGKAGQAIEARITALAKEYAEAGEYVVFAVDLHYAGDTLHPENKLFPPHNIAGTEGRALYGSLGALYEQIKDLPNVLWMDKTRYSCFAGTPLQQLLTERGIREVALCGVCTDICVLHTAVEAYNLGYGITVHGDAVASFSPEGHSWALGHFSGSLGAAVQGV
ncbi:MAG: cysteine hydrolase [Oscillospiraceae bacterium]|nr:cysteine hydrolase [Oscillospiraceae bacterium]